MNELAKAMTALSRQYGDLKVLHDELSAMQSAPNANRAMKLITMLTKASQTGVELGPMWLATRDAAVLAISTRMVAIAEEMVEIANDMQAETEQ
jgi:hypothetical protein